MSAPEITQILKRLEEMDNHHKSIHEELKEDLAGIKKQLGPVVELYDTAKGFTIAVKWIFGVLIAVGSAILLIRSLFEAK